MKNKTFAEALHLLGNIFFNRKGEVRSPDEDCSANTRQPERVKRVQVGKTVFVVGTFFKDDGKDTLKDILERSIKREVCSGLKN